MIVDFDYHRELDCFRVHISLCLRITGCEVRMAWGGERVGHGGGTRAHDSGPTPMSRAYNEQPKATRSKDYHDDG